MSDFSFSSASPELSALPVHAGDGVWHTGHETEGAGFGEHGFASGLRGLLPHDCTAGWDAASPGWMAQADGSAARRGGHGMSECMLPV